ncbi:MAG: hypothetical protein U1F09_05755 [Steroidobacteraceae bacterium]
MVLYHWINYFIGPQWEHYKYLRFLTPSFIFITGFMVSNVYLSKYQATDPQLPKRLISRGVKLLLIFIALNIARSCLVPILGTGTIPANVLELRNLWTIFFSGNLPVAGSKLISFSILVPISYLLMISGLMMHPMRVFRFSFHLLCVLLLASIVMLGLAGLQSANLELVTIGVLGVMVGFSPISSVNKFVRRPWRLGLAYLLYVTAVALWDVPFVVQLVGVPLSVAVIYYVGLGGSGAGRIGPEIVLLGRYSLYGYLSQIAILQVLAVAFRPFDVDWITLTASFIAAFALTIASVEIADRLRARLATVDRLYRAIFA